MTLTWTPREDGTDVESQDVPNPLEKTSSNRYLGVAPALVGPVQPTRNVLNLILGIIVCESYFSFMERQDEVGYHTYIRSTKPLSDRGPTIQ